MIDKSDHLLQYVDWTRPELAPVQASPDPAAALVAHLARSPRPRFRFEYERKTEILAFLRERYGRWRNYDTAAAERVATLSIADARKARALAGVPELGKAWWATGDSAWGQAFERFYLSAPTGDMFNWYSFNGSQAAIELDAFFLLLDCDGFSTEGRIAFLDHFATEADDAWDTHTSKWPQTALGPEGHNWYLHGMHVLPFLGLLFPEFKRAPFFLRTGMSVVEEHVRGHFRADGGARETTLGYQAGSMLNLWDFQLIARRNGQPLSPDFDSRLMAATLFMLRLASPVGGTPSFGDTHHVPGGLTRLAAVAAALTGDGACKWYAERFRPHIAGAGAEAPGEIPLCAFWEVGLAGAATYAATQARNPHHASVLMGQTGYAALRDSDRADGAYLAIAAADRGPIVTSHGHNEVFSIEVHASGTRFIGEMGCAPYGTTPGRDYDEKTEAHSCLSIDGMEQAALSGEWRWRSHVIPCVRRWISEDTHDFFHGVHEGFYRYPEHQTLHARKVLFIKSAPSYWVIFDWVESAVENDYRIYFHGTVPASRKGRSILLGEAAGPQLAIVPPAKDRLTLERVSSPGLTAYMRETKTDPKRYPCFAYGRRSKSDCLVWVLAPSGAGIPEVRRLPVTVNGAPEDAHGAAAVEVRFGRFTDVMCLSHKDFDADLSFGGQELFGFLGLRRFDGKGKPLLSVDHRMSDGICGR